MRELPSVAVTAGELATLARMALQLAELSSRMPTRRHLERQAIEALRLAAAAAEVEATSRGDAC